MIYTGLIPTARPITHQAQPGPWPTSFFSARPAVYLAQADLCYFPLPCWSHGNSSHFPTNLMKPSFPSSLISWSPLPSTLITWKPFSLLTDCQGNRDNWSSYSIGYWSSAGIGLSWRGCSSWLSLDIDPLLIVWQHFECNSRSLIAKWDFFKTWFFFRPNFSSASICSLQLVLFKTCLFFNFRLPRLPISSLKSSFKIYL